MREKRADRVVRVLRAQGIQLERRVGHECRAPRRSRVQELRTCESHDHDAMVSQVRAQIVDEIERGVVGPMHIVEHDHHRRLLGETLEEPTGGVLKLKRFVRPFIEPKAHEEREVARHRRHLVGREERREQRRDLLACGFYGIVLEDAGRLPHHLLGRVVRRLLIVRKAASPEDTSARRFNHGTDLGGQPRLPDARRTDHGDQMRLPRADGAFPDGADEKHLVVASDQRCTRRVTRVRRIQRFHHKPCRHGFALPLRLDRRQRLVAERVLGELVRLRSDDRPPGRC